MSAARSTDGRNIAPTAAAKCPSGASASYLSSTHPERERAKVEQMIDRLVEYLEEVQRL